MTLRRIALAANNHTVAYSGVAGGALVIAALWKIDADLSDPTFLSNFIHEIRTHSPGDATYAIFALLNSAIFAVVISTIATLFGRTPAIADEHPSDVGADARLPPQPVAAVTIHDAGTAGGRSPHMTTETEISIALGILNMFAGSNPTVQEAEVVLPQIMTAIANEKAGQSFSVSVPLPLGGVKGTASFSWYPTAAAAAPAPAAA